MLQRYRKSLTYLTCLVTGFVILVLELTSFRLLAPHYGVSNVITGIIINTILLALAVGYLLGGYVADLIVSGEAERCEPGGVDEIGHDVQAGDDPHATREPWSIKP